MDIWFQKAFSFDTLVRKTKKTRGNELDGKARWVWGPNNFKRDRENFYSLVEHCVSTVSHESNGKNGF